MAKTYQIGDGGDDVVITILDGNNVTISETGIPKGLLVYRSYIDGATNAQIVQLIPPIDYDVAELRSGVRLTSMQTDSGTPFPAITDFKNYLNSISFFLRAGDGSGSLAISDLTDQVSTLNQSSSDQDNYNSANNVAIANLNFSTATASSSAASALNLASSTYKAISANTTLVAADWSGKGVLYVEVNANSATITVVMPLSSTCTGLKVIIGKVDSSANAVTINKNASDTSIGGSAGTPVTTQTIGSVGTSLRFVPNAAATGWFKI